MRNIYRVLAVILVAAMLIPFGSAVMADGTDEVIVTARDQNVNLRLAPVDGEVWGRLLTSTFTPEYATDVEGALEAVGRNADGSWLQLATRNSEQPEVWAIASALNVTGDADALPVVEGEADEDGDEASDGLEVITPEETGDELVLGMTKEQAEAYSGPSYVVEDGNLVGVPAEQLVAWVYGSREVSEVVAAQYHAVAEPTSVIWETVTDQDPQYAFDADTEASFEGPAYCITNLGVNPDVEAELGDLDREDVLPSYVGDVIREGGLVVGVLEVGETWEFGASPHHGGLCLPLIPAELEEAEAAMPADMAAAASSQCVDGATTFVLAVGDAEGTFECPTLEAEEVGVVSDAVQQARDLCAIPGAMTAEVSGVTIQCADLLAADEGDEG